MDILLTNATQIKQVGRVTTTLQYIPLKIDMKGFLLFINESVNYRFIQPVNC